VVQRANLFQSVREWIVSDIVKERGRSDDRLLVLVDRMLGFAQQCQRPAREVVRPKGVLESGVGGAGINEVRPAELADVPEALKDIGVEKGERQLVDSNVVPDGVAQDLETHGLAPSRRAARQPFGPAFWIAVSTSPNFSKFLRNISASFLACAS
jgi:hypothetical protein